MSTLQTYNLKHPDAAGNNIAFDSSGHATFSNTVKTSKIENASTANGGVAIDSDGHVQVDGIQLPTGGQLSQRNLLYNGAATVYQRGENTSISANANNFATDRWQLEVDNGGTWTLSQSTDAPSGFGYSHKLDCTTANASLVAGSVLLFQQRLEGQDLQQLDKGTSNAKKLTLSFYVKSAKTGTYIVEFQDANNGRLCQRSYTISTADTWEFKTLTIPGDTTGALQNNNGHSFTIRFWLAAGSTFQSGTLQTDWGSTVNANRVVGQVNLADNTSNNWLVTGIQLEVGEKATPFEHRSYGDELLRCQRYYYKHPLERYRPALVDGNGAYAGAFVSHPVQMRAVPSISCISFASFYYNASGAGGTSMVPDGSISNVVYTGDALTGIANVTGNSNLGGTSKDQITGQWHCRFDFHAEL